MTERAGFITVYCLGPLQVWCGDREVLAEDWHKPKALSLVKLLLTHRNTWVPVEEILDGLWPEMDQARGLNNFRVTLHHARQALATRVRGADAPPGVAASAVGAASNADAASSAYAASNADAVRAKPPTRATPIQYLRRQCRLDPDVVRVDTGRFVELVREGWRLVRDERVQGAAERFAAADALYRGDFVADDPYSDWLQPERDRLRDMELEALEWLAEYWTQAGVPAQGIKWARRLLTLDPYREDTYRQLMVNLERSGRPGEALVQYRLCQRLFSSQLGVAVSAQTTRLYQAITASSLACSEPGGSSPGEAG